MTDDALVNDSSQTAHAIVEQAEPIHRARRQSRHPFLIASAIACLGWGILFYNGWFSNRSVVASADVAAGSKAGDLNDAPHPGAVKVSEEQLGNIEVQKAAEQKLPQRLSVSGRVGFNEDQTVPILAPIAGQVVDLKARVGDHVRRGDALFCLKSREVAAVQSEYQEGLKDRDLAEKTFNMTRELFSHNAASNIALQQAENDLAKARTRAARIEEQLRVLGLDPLVVASANLLTPCIPVRAPRDGTVVERHITEGQFVPGDGTALVTVADLSSVWIVADVFERDLHEIRLKQPAEVTTLAYPDNHFIANVTYISSCVDPQTRTVKVRLLAPNEDGRLKPEMFASVSLVLAENMHAILVSDQAVVTNDGRGSVFVRTGRLSFEERPVDTSPAGIGQVEVLHGLTTGEEVVSHGALLLRQLEESSETLSEG